MKRCAYVLIPFSILMIKYYPQYGRAYEAWSGAPMNTGITTNKNLLGCDCLILGFFFVWHFLKTWRLPRSMVRRNELLLCAGFLVMIWWLLFKSNSQTSLMALLVGIFVLLFAGWQAIDRRHIGTYLVFGTVCIVGAELTFGIYDTVLVLLGRDATLTERTFLWEDLLKADIDPLLGAGFESFWLGERMAELWIKHPFRPNQAHNGYLETYLNLGLIGLFMLLGLIIATYSKARRELLNNFEFGRFRLGYLAAAVAYNWTEAGFKTLHFVFFVFYIIAIDYRPARREVPGGGGRKLGEEAEKELVLQPVA
jgi:O-antigen ligase